ncbi:TPA: LysR family transcriptional regulator [Candidatus Ventrenecus stercoripullorum]|nr:LysR family transcriptional regulator [Candidatus Ventrenecus stercoripullorum]
MDEVNLNSLRIFLEVANSKSFLDASERLFVSQPAISKSMSKLEEHLGITLFYRTNSGISLTASGEVLYKYLKETKDLLLSCERVLKSMNDIENGKIIIGVQSHIVRNYLMEKIDDFRLRHPKIKIQLIDQSTISLINDLEEQKTDFVVDAAPIETNYNNIEVKPICSLSTCFVKSPKNISKIEQLKDLEHENLILPAARSSLRKNLNICFKRSSLEMIPILEFETEELIIEATRRNLGIGYVVKPAVEYLVESKILEYIDINEKLPKMEINLVFISKHLTDVAKLFIKEEINYEDKHL